MTHIRVLPKDVASRIAAGEVVVRPASVVKELLENALDAGASQVEVHVRKSGKSLILVQDNGCGMSQEDLLLSIKHHATSKIRDDRDLFRIESYGFRGEALPSIASVATLQLSTAQKQDSCGHTLLLEGGQIVKQGAVSRQPGTSIEVRNLFFNTPARRKFLKNDVTELNHIMDAVVNQALCCLSVQFKLLHEDKTLVDLPAVDTLEQRLQDLYGKALVQALYACESIDGPITLSGCVSRPEFTRSNRTLQRFFVNQRCVQDKNLSMAVHAAYKNVLPAGRHAVSFLFVKLPADQIDINVHPSKTEVKFHQDQRIKNLVHNTIKQSLDAMAQDEQVLAAPPVLASASIDSRQDQQDQIVRTVQSFHRQIDAEAFSHQDNKRSTTPPSAKSKSQMIESSEVSVSPAAPQTTQSTDFDRLRHSPHYDFWSQDRVAEHIPDPVQKSVLQEESPVFEAHSVQTEALEVHPDPLQPFLKAQDLYVISVQQDGLLIFDQHAAQERVIYEKILRRFQNESKPVQDLLIPLQLELGVTDIPLMQSLLGAFEELGFVLELFGPEMFLVRTVPTYIREKDVISTIHDLLDHVRDLGYPPQSILQHFDEVIATMACRASIKAGDHVEDDELEHILRELQNCDDPNTCPHGRPTMIRIPFSELEKKFRRIKA